MKSIGLFRIGRDAVVRFTQSGEPVVNLSLAYNYGKSVDGKRPSEWIDASLWGKRGEALAQYLLAGSQIEGVLSDLHMESYESKDGVKVKLVARVDDVELISNKQQSSQQSSAPARQQAPAKEPAPAASGSGFNDFDDDIPF